MSNTYCGKSCTECTQKEALGCPGCKTGPGRTFAGECKLAQCCQKKGHESCDTCGFKENCGILRMCHQQPEIRKKKMELQQNRSQEMIEKAPFLGKWLWILFWLFVPSGIANILSNENIANLAPGIYLFGEILASISAFAYGFVLLKLSSQERQYRKAGFYSIISAVLSILVIVIISVAETLILPLLLTIPLLVVALVGQYYEFNAHAATLYHYRVDYELANKWKVLWKCNIGCMIALICSILVVLILPILGFLALLVAAIAIIVIGIMKLVYLYKTAMIFRGLALDCG